MNHPVKIETRDQITDMIEKPIPTAEHDAEQRRRQEEEEHFQLPLRPGLPSTSATRQPRATPDYRLLDEVRFKAFVYIIQ